MYTCVYTYIYICYGSLLLGFRVMLAPNWSLDGQRMAFHVDLSSTATIVQIVGRYSATLDNDGAQRSRDKRGKSE